MYAKAEARAALEAKLLALPSPRTAEEAAPPPAAALDLDDLESPGWGEASWPIVIGGGALWAGLAVLTLAFASHSVASNYVASSWLHLVNLVFHEAGHVVFAPLGSFVTALGGSLFQVIVPVVCGVALLRGRDAFGASVAAWWAAQNLVDLAPYIDDARNLRLVLLGGHTGAEVTGHDWEFILTSLGWLHLDHRLAAVAQGAGVAGMVGALAWGLVELVRRARVLLHHRSAGPLRRPSGRADSLVDR